MQRTEIKITTTIYFMPNILRNILPSSTMHTHVTRSHTYTYTLYIKTRTHLRSHIENDAINMYEYDRFETVRCTVYVNVGPCRVPHKQQ